MITRLTSLRGNFQIARFPRGHRYLTSVPGGTYRKTLHFPSGDNDVIISVLSIVIANRSEDNNIKIESNKMLELIRSI